MAAAEQHNDEKLLRRIRGFDVFSCEAKYHPSCRLKYIRDPAAWQSKDEESKSEQKDLEKAHNEAFQKVCVRVEQEVLQLQMIVKLSDLCDTYISALSETNHQNENYRREKLKRKLEKAYGKKLVFASPYRKAGEYQSMLVYSSEMNTEKAIITAYELGCADTVKDTALYLRTLITEAFQKSENLPWPPTDEYLQNHDILPHELKKFLNYLLAGQAEDHTPKVQRLVTSLGQDILRAVTKGHWKLPKHILLCMTLRHLFRSKELVTMINRFGHCDSYVFSLELETAIATAVNTCSSVLTSQIVLQPPAPSVFHSEFDNFDVFISTLEGQTSAHTAHGIMMQEVGNGKENMGTGQLLPSAPRTRILTFNVPQAELPECYVGTRKNPNYPCKHNAIIGGKEALEKARKVHLIWLLCQLHSALRADQQVPAWAGFISLLGDRPERKTTIGYYPVINKPITENSTMQECLRLAEQASHEVGQEYVITTLDLGACMKAFPLIWNNSDQYKQHIILIGTFHTICAYLKVI